MGDKNGFNPFAMARERFDRIADLLELEPNTRKLLRSPMRELRFQVPVRMDDGTVQSFDGFRVQHNDARGPCMGGLRFHPLETIDTIRALAMWMTWKTAAVGIPVGGSMGGVICDPHSLSRSEQEAICRGWVRQMGGNLSPELDVPAPDMMTDAQHMLWMLSEYESMNWGHHPGAISGKPVGIGGSVGQRQATGYGVVYLLREAMKELDLSPENTTAAVQGFGKVAQFMVELYHQIGGRVLCVTSWSQAAGRAYCYRRRDGVDLGELRGITNYLGSIDTERARDLGYEVMPAEEWLQQDVDILVPAAIENQITADNVEMIRPSVKVIAEGANGAINQDADALIAEHGLFLIPDLIANAGGVLTSYFENVQSRMNYYWDLAEVLAKLDMQLTNTFMSVRELANTRGLSMRDAAEALAVERVARTCVDRGLA